jgi:hypothetical protein
VLPTSKGSSLLSYFIFTVHYSLFRCSQVSLKWLKLISYLHTKTSPVWLSCSSKMVHQFQYVLWSFKRFCFCNYVTSFKAWSPVAHSRSLFVLISTFWSASDFCPPPPGQPPILLVPWAVFLGLKQTGGHTDHSHPSSTEVKKEWSCNACPPYAFMAHILICGQRPADWRTICANCRHHLWLHPVLMGSAPLLPQPCPTSAN